MCVPVQLRFILRVLSCVLWLNNKQTTTQLPATSAPGYSYYCLLVIIISYLSLLGHVPNGLKCHPDQEHLIYPLGCTILIQAINTNEQKFLHGHGNNVSCLTISKEGDYIASGQVTFMGFKVNKMQRIHWTDLLKSASLEELPDFLALCHARPSIILCLLSLSAHQAVPESLWCLGTRCCGLWLQTLSLNLLRLCCCQSRFYHMV